MRTLTRQEAFTFGSAALATLLAAGAVVVLRPEWVVTWLADRSPDVLYYVDTDQPIVALTIDDGPDPDGTPPILDLLKRHGAQATFFLIGNHIAGNEEVVARTVREGHELGNHLTTDDPSILLDSAEFERQLRASHRVLSQFADVRWFRPGSGWYNNAMLSTLDKYGYRCALGSVYPFDPQVPNPSFMAYYVLHNVQPGSIIVLHDHGGRGERTAQALEVILPQLAERGFRVTTLSELVDATGS